MIYLFVIISLTANVLLIWYIRKLLQKYWFDVEAREKFTEMLTDYSEALRSIHKLEELYGEEIIKKTIIQTDFVIEACKEFREAIEGQTKTQEGSQEINEEDYEEEDSSPEASKESVIRLREGEKVTQDADRYKRVVIEDL